jgi:hypothetical protein
MTTGVDPSFEKYAPKTSHVESTRLSGHCRETMGQLNFPNNAYLAAFVSAFLTTLLGLP